MFKNTNTHTHLSHRDFTASEKNQQHGENNHSFQKVLLTVLKQCVAITAALISGIAAGAAAGYFLLGIWGILFGGIITFFTAASICRMISFICNRKNENSSRRVHFARKIKAEIWNIICIISGVAIGYLIGSWWSLVISTAIGLFIGKTIVDKAVSYRYRYYRKEY